MQVIDGALNHLLATLPHPPFQRDTLDKLVSAAVTEVEPKTSSENRKTLWEYALRNEVLTLAVRAMLSTPRVVHSGQCSVGHRRPSSERPIYALLRRPEATAGSRTHLHREGRMRADLSVQHPVRPPRNTDDRILLAHILMDREPLRPAHGGHGSPEGQGPRTPAYP